MPEKPYQVRSTFSSISIDKTNSVEGFLKRWWWVVVIVVVVFGALAFFAYNYLDTRNKLVQLQGGDTETQQLVNKITQYLELPQETPTLATISEASKVQDQAFFKNAQTGDKVLIYPEAGRALLYRPSSGKVIEYSRVNLNTTPQGQQP
jgi:hypothetical protein